MKIIITSAVITAVLLSCVNCGRELARAVQEREIIICCSPHGQQ